MVKQTKIFKRNKWNDFLFFLLCLGMAIGGCFFLEKDPVMAWLGIVLFGSGTILLLLHLLTNSSYLKLDEEGFEVKTLLVTKKTKWSHIEGFRQVNFRGNKTICFDYTDEYNEFKRGKKRFKLFDKKSGGVASCYTIKTNKLLNLMIVYKRKSKRKFK